MKQEKQIRQAIEAARADGLRIIRGGGAAFTNGQNGIEACDATGAVLYSLGVYSLDRGWLAVLCDALDVDSFWMWRFWMGWDRDTVLTRIDDDGREHADDVSAWARKLGRELCGAEMRERGA
jgi:hypothetical protein